MTTRNLFFNLPDELQTHIKEYEHELYKSETGHIYFERFKRILKDWNTLSGNEFNSKKRKTKIKEYEDLIDVFNISKEECNHTTAIEKLRRRLKYMIKSRKSWLEQLGINVNFRDTDEAKYVINRLIWLLDAR